MAVAGWSGRDYSSLHPLEESEWLVGLPRTIIPGGGQPFPGPSDHVIHLPNPIDGPAMAWETLDAILCSTAKVTETVARPSGRNLVVAGVDWLIAENSSQTDHSRGDIGGHLDRCRQTLALPDVVDTERLAPITAGSPAVVRISPADIVLLGTFFA